jgi:hypothetical protein
VSPELKRYLTERYRRDVLRESVEITPLTTNGETIDEIKAEIARIDAIGLGANLAQRDFVSYQHRRALESLLPTLEVTGTMRASEGPDRASFTGHTS